MNDGITTPEVWTAVADGYFLIARSYVVDADDREYMVAKAQVNCVAWLSSSWSVRVNRALRLTVVSSRNDAIDLRSVPVTSSAEIRAFKFTTQVDTSPSA